MSHVSYSFVTYQWSCQKGPANAPPVPDSQCATMTMETSDKAKTYSQAMCQCCDDLCNSEPCKAWNSDGGTENCDCQENTIQTIMANNPQAVRELCNAGNFGNLSLELLLFSFLLVTALFK